MSFDAWMVAALAVLALAAAITGRLGLDAVGIVMIAVLVGTGILDLPVALAGFSNNTVVTLAGLYVIGEALTRTGALEFVAARAIHHSKGSELRLVLLLAFTAAAISAFVSDTAVVLVFMPLAIGIARDRGIPLSRLLLPIAYAALLGGTMTLVGSTINLLASGAVESYGLPRFGFFEMTPIALPLVLLGVPLTVLLVRRLLPDRVSLTNLLATSSSREFVTEITIPAGSLLIGKPVRDAHPNGPQALAVVRDEDIVWTVGGGEHLLAAGDVIMATGQVRQIAALQSDVGLHSSEAVAFDPRTTSYFELAVAPHAPAVGARIADLRLLREFGVIVIAVLRRQRHIRGRVTRMELRPGDVLLVCGDEASQTRLRSSNDFYLLTGSQHQVAQRRLARRALAIVGVVAVMFVAGAPLGLGRALPIPIICLLGAAAMVAAGCISARRAYQSIDWRILVFVVGALALGRAMETSGLAGHCAHGLVALLAPWGPLAVVSGIMALGTVLNQFTSPYAVVLLLTPIAIATAHDLGVDVRPFVLAIAFAGSNAFATPMGHQVNLMVMGPGGYRYGDYLRVGLPLCVFTWLVVTVGLALTGGW